MNLLPYIENINRQLAVTAEAAGPDARALSERLVATLDAALRLTLQDVLAAAAEEITTELAPGSVELRLRGREPEFVVTLPHSGRSVDATAEGAGDTGWRPADIGRSVPAAEGGESGMSRINLRMPDQLKSRIEQAAASEGLSVNAWLVRAASAALERAHTDPRRDQDTPSGGRHFKGWAR